MTDDWENPEPKRPKDRDLRKLIDAMRSLYGVIDRLSTAEVRWVDALLESTAYHEENMVDTLWNASIEIAHGEVAPLVLEHGWDGEEIMQDVLLPAAKEDRVVDLDDIENHYKDYEHPPVVEVER